MSVIVQKYGGTSVANLKNIEFIAKKISKLHQVGEKIVVVVSAMAGETNRLEELARQVAPIPSLREFDVLLATGEQVTTSLLAIALIKLGCPAVSYMGHQVKIQTDSVHGKARIINVNKDNIENDLNNNKVVVVAGFQGIDEKGNITTLGRGGSDTTAVAIAAALKAKECSIYTDVAGVYTADPKIVPSAKLMQQVTFEEILELASLGAKVLQIRAVELAGNYDVPVRVLSTFEEGPGTLISYEEVLMENKVVSGITFCRDEARIIIRGVPDIPGIASKILGPIGDVHIEVDMIVQNISADGTTDFTFTLHRKDLQQAVSIIEPIAIEMSAQEITSDDKIAKLSLVGVGMRSHAGVASKMFTILGQEGINIQLISTSEIKVSVLLDEKYLELGVRALHEAFNLGE